MNTENKNKRYSEADLAEFKILIEKKLEKTQEQLAALEVQLTNTAESKDNEGDWMDDSTSNVDMEMLEVMANRQRKHLWDLQNALQRIYNKSYGICSVTSELIDKRRLLAVPTTTKSLSAKLIGGDQAPKKIQKVEEKPRSSKPVIISRVIRKTETKPTVAQKWEEEDEDDLDLEMDVDLDLSSEVDLDVLSEEDLD